jgi:lauroyl/myristoyl acyltransferase
MSTAALLWADRFDRSPWSGRIDLSQIETLRALAASRPVLLATVHYGGIFVMPTLLRSHGIPTAAVVGDKLWPVRWWRERRAALTHIADLPAHLRSGDARAMVRYLQPGRCLLVALDYPIGDQVATPFDGSALRLSTASFKLARMTGATIVPVIVRVEGTWRYSVHVGRPVPREVLAAGEDAPILAHIVSELMPIAQRAPEQALPLLVNAFETAAPA